MKAVGYILGVPAFVALSVIWRGYVLTILWAWFVVPTFGAPVLAIAPAIGLTLVMGYLTQHTQGAKKDETFDERLLSAAAQAAALPALALLVGWVVQHWMPA